MSQPSVRVAVVGAGGLGCPVALTLAEAGCSLVLIDDDVVELSNLQRQVLFATPDLGKAKLEAAAEALRARLGSVELILRPGRMTSENAEALLEGADLAIDASDDPQVRFLVNAWGLRHKRPVVIGGVHRFQGMVFAHNGQGPCFACVFDEDGPEVETCSAAGVIGALAGVVGHLQAEAVLVLLGLLEGESPVGRLQSIDALSGTTRTLKLSPQKGCPACGGHPEPT